MLVLCSLNYIWAKSAFWQLAEHEKMTSRSSIEREKAGRTVRWLRLNMRPVVALSFTEQGRKENDSCTNFEWNDRWYPMIVSGVSDYVELDTARQFSCKAYEELLDRLRDRFSHPISRQIGRLAENIVHTAIVVAHSSIFIHPSSRSINREVHWCVFITSKSIILLMFEMISFVEEWKIGSPLCESLLSWWILLVSDLHFPRIKMQFVIIRLQMSCIHQPRLLRGVSF